MSFLEDISFEKGQDLLVKVTMTPPTNITGWTLQLSVRQHYGDAVMVFSVGSGSIVITDSANGLFQITVASALTSGLTPECYVYDIQRIDPGSRVVLTRGNLILQPEVAL